MIKFKKTEVVGWKAAIRSMRNPTNSWDNSDSKFTRIDYCYEQDKIDKAKMCGMVCPDIGPNDLDLMKRLRNAGADNRKFMGTINVTVDITAPLYWWKEFDTYYYKVGSVDNSCSTAHKIIEKEFTLDDFSHEHLIGYLPHTLMDQKIFNGGLTSPKENLEKTIAILNFYRELFVNWDKYLTHESVPEGVTKKDIWWQIIQLLPSSYDQKRTVMLNYEVLVNMYKSYKNHKLDEWGVHEPEWEFDIPGISDFGFCDWIKTLPYSALITGEFEED